MRISIPRPCQESWANMTPSGNGRHCQRCQSTVIDFTQQSDAEILAYLARAAGGRSCGRFAAGQLERPLQRAAPAASWRWQAWLTAAVALWGLREAAGSEARAQAPTEQRAVPASPQLEHSARREVEALASGLVLQGRVTDAATGEGLSGVSIIISSGNETVEAKSSRTGIVTGPDGAFVLPYPAAIKPESHVVLIQYLGYASQLLHPSPAQWHGQALQLQMELDVKGEILGKRPWPWRPRLFYYWAKYQLTRPFR